MSHRLEEIERDMRGLFDPEDPETAHSRADELLVETLDLLVPEVDPDQGAAIANILTAYANIHPKWYA